MKTPNLDRLAANGLRFTQFYNTSRCWPSRAALLTGYYAQQVRRDLVPGVQSGARGTRPKWASLLPEIFALLGYRSYHSGKWHVDGMPLATGFDRSYYLEDVGRYFHPRVLYLDDDGSCLRSIRPRDIMRPRPSPSTEIEFLARSCREPSVSPFFLYLAFNTPHFPLQARRTTSNRYRGRYRDGWESFAERAPETHRRSGLGQRTLWISSLISARLMTFPRP